MFFSSDLVYAFLVYVFFVPMAMFLVLVLLPIKKPPGGWLNFEHFSKLVERRPRPHRARFWLDGVKKLSPPVDRGAQPPSAA
jgi:hypothetical protein